MAKRTLFSILSEQPWWVSLAVAAGLFAIAYPFLPQLAIFVALPFIGVAAYAAWQQWRGKSPVGAAERLAALREMPREKFSAIIGEAYRRQGYTVETADDDAFDFVLRKNGRITLVQCRRWKGNQVGIGAVRALCEAMARHDAFNGVCISAAPFSDSARRFAAGKPVTLISGVELAQLVGKIKAA
ncbi:MAG: restriction endonuclease [Burkholderiales bacterium]